MSRIEQVMRELSDLREFYLKLKQRHAGSSPVSSSLVVAEEASDYNSKSRNEGISKSKGGQGARSEAKGGSFRKSLNSSSYCFSSGFRAMENRTLENAKRAVFASGFHLFLLRVPSGLWPSTGSGP